MTHQQRLDEAAARLERELRARKLRIVFAESCTAGLLSASLSRFPGISEFLCGSAVAYRDSSKSAWLNVSPSDLADPDKGAVSPEVAEQMCAGILKETVEADLAAAVTGHLGPDAPAELDGVICICVGDRSGSHVDRRRLTSAAEGGLTLRSTRQVEASAIVFEAVLRFLQSPLQTASSA